jgi:shikimate kinase
MSNIFLVGFMGAGKTSVGQALAKRLSYQFLDLDECLSTRFGMSISEVFRDHGEDVFREAEAEEMHRAADLDRCVVATGGGAFCSETNRLVIAGSGGVSVFLDVPWEVLRSRLRGATSDRPMFGDTASARGLFDRRLPHYRQATLTVPVTEEENPEETATRIVAALREVPCVS